MARQIVRATYMISWLIGLAAAVFVALDVDAVVIGIFLIMSVVAAAFGQIKHLSQGKVLTLPRHIALIPVASYLTCFLVAAAALAIGHSDLLGDGFLRAQWRPIELPPPVEIHDAALPIKLGEAEIKVISARLIPDEKTRGPKLKIVIEISNTSRTTVIGDLTMVSTGTLRDDLGNRYAKAGYEPMKFVSSKRGGDPHSLYPEERAELSLFFEPPIEQADHLDLTLSLSGLTSSRGLLIRIPRVAWAIP